MYKLTEVCSASRLFLLIVVTDSLVVSLVSPTNSSLRVEPFVIAGCFEIRDVLNSEFDLSVVTAEVSVLILAVELTSKFKSAAVVDELIRLLSLSDVDKCNGVVCITSVEDSTDFKIVIVLIVCVLIIENPDGSEFRSKLLSGARVSELEVGFEEVERTVVVTSSW